MCSGHSRTDCHPLKRSLLSEQGCQEKDKQQLNEFRGLKGQPCDAEGQP